MSDGTCMIRPKISKRRAETLRFYLKPNWVPGGFHFNGVEDPIRVFSRIASPLPVRKLTARIALQIQFPATLQLLADFAVAAGINDWGGVSPLTPDFINPEAPWPALQTLKQKSAEAGFDLKARLPIYPEFIAQAEKFLPASLLSYVGRLGDATGLVKGGGPVGGFAAIQRSDSPAL